MDDAQEREPFHDTVESSALAAPSSNLREQHEQPYRDHAGEVDKDDLAAAGAAVGSAKGRDLGVGNNDDYDPGADIASFYPDKSMVRSVVRSNKQNIMWFEWIYFFVSLSILITGIVLKAKANTATQFCDSNAEGKATATDNSLRPKDLTALQGYEWALAGEEMFGPLHANDKIGYGQALALSGDGERLIVTLGLPTSAKNKNKATVDVLHWSGGQWQKEASLKPPSQASSQPTGDHQVVAMSKDGRRAAFTQKNNVFVFERVSDPDNSEQWKQYGKKLDFPKAVTFGTDISFSADGSVVAITGSLDGETEEGFVQVLHIVTNEEGEATTNWQQKGGLIRGHRIGGSIVLNEDGHRLAVGTIPDQQKNIEEWSGVIRMYEFPSDDSSEWNQVGQSLPGSSYFGTLDMSNRGDTVIVGTEYSDSHYATVYKLHFQASEWRWEQWGSLLSGDSELEKVGIAVAMSQDGNVVAVGAPGSPQEIEGLMQGKQGDQNGLEKYMYGRVRLYQFDHNAEDWEMIGNPIHGSGRGDEFGMAIGLSAFGGRVAVGAPQRKVGELSNVGVVESFDWKQAV